jgi:hypothetical protein
MSKQIHTPHMDALHKEPTLYCFKGQDVLYWGHVRLSKKMLRRLIKELQQVERTMK